LLLGSDEKLLILSFAGRTCLFAVDLAPDEPTSAGIRICRTPSLE
jgi:hypothetical protein